MKIAILSGKPVHGTSFRDEEDFVRALTKAGIDTGVIDPDATFSPDWDMLLSLGGDGTFLKAASLAAPVGVPVLGVNSGRMGFLSENSLDDAAKALLCGDYKIVERTILQAKVDGRTHYAMNEVVVSRVASAMLGVEITLDGKKLPACWGDGLLVSTPSGSTAYSMSVGGPLVLPASKVLIIAPVAPHNLNIRPIVVPQESKIALSFISRDAAVKFSADNDFWDIPAGSVVELELAPFVLRKVKLDGSSFIKALSDKLHWGEDKRNQL